MRRLHERSTRARGLVVDTEGVMLGPDWVLARRTPAGYRCAGAEEIDLLRRLAFGDDLRLQRLPIVLASIATALERGDLVKAQLLGLALPIDELTDHQLQRLHHASDLIKDFNPDQPRDERGRWTDEGDAAASGATAPQGGLAQLWLSSLSSAPGSSHGSTSGSVTDAGYQGYYHDYLVQHLLVQHLAQVTRDHGGQAITSVPMVAVTGDTAIADLIVKPRGWPSPFILEVKTGNDPTFTLKQARVYPLAMIGGHVTSRKADVTQVGLVPGAPFPPLPVLAVYTRGPGAEMYYKWLMAPIEKLLSFLLIWRPA